MSRLKTVVLLFCLVLTTAAAATAQVTGSTTLTVSRAVIYVNKDSSCPGSGTIGSPYCSIQNAFNVAAAGDDIRMVQRLLGYRSVQATMIYTHVLNRGGRGVQSPVDRL